MSMQEVQALGSATQHLANSLGYSPEAVRAERSAKEYEDSAVNREKKRELDLQTTNQALANAPNIETQRQLDLLETEGKLTTNRLTDIHAEWSQDPANKVNYNNPKDVADKAASFDDYVRSNHSEDWNPRYTKEVFSNSMLKDLDRIETVGKAGIAIGEQLVDRIGQGLTKANGTFYTPDTEQAPAAESGQEPALAGNNSARALKTLGESINPTMGRIDPDFKDAFQFTVSDKKDRNGQPLVNLSHPDFVEAMELDGKKEGVNLSTVSKNNMTMQEVQTYLGGLVQKNGKHIPTGYVANQNNRTAQNLQNERGAKVAFSGVTGENLRIFKVVDKDWNETVHVTGDGLEKNDAVFASESEAKTALGLYYLKQEEEDYLKIVTPTWYKNSGGKNPTKAIRRMWAQGVTDIRQNSYKKGGSGDGSSGGGKYLKAVIGNAEKLFTTDDPNKQGYLRALSVYTDDMQDMGVSEDQFNSMAAEALTKVEKRQQEAYSADKSFDFQSAMQEQMGLEIDKRKPANVPTQAEIDKTKKDAQKVVDDEEISDKKKAENLEKIHKQVVERYGESGRLDRWVLKQLETLTGTTQMRIIEKGIKGINAPKTFTAPLKRSLEAPNSRS
jgi:hypothetical protein